MADWKVRAAWRRFTFQTGIEKEEWTVLQRCKRICQRVLGANGIYTEELFEPRFDGDNYGDYVGIQPHGEFAKALGFDTLKEAKEALGAP